MKHLKLATALLTTLALGTSAMAASSGTLVISGTVALVNDIVITPNAAATSLNITAGETARLVGIATETSNNLNGYKIQASSANGGFLVNTSSTTQKTAYKLGYDNGTAVTLGTTVSTLKNVSSLTGLISANSNIKVDVVAFATAPAGTYSDTVTISIVAN